jgi:molybdopterin molybdotransferase
MRTQVLGFAEALEVVLSHARTVRLPRLEEVALLDAAGRVLGEPVFADRDQPPFDRATRDGLAVHAKEWSGGVRLRIAGQVRAGEVWRGGAMEAGCAIEIMTGAPVPVGADAVAMVEHAQHEDGEVWAEPGRLLRAGENIVPQASEARAGEALLAAGTEISAAEIALAAACGRANLGVRKRPVVAIVATGDELVEVNELPRAQQIRNSNSYALAVLATLAGARVNRLDIARDTREDVRQRIAQGRTADLLLLSGGVSAGKYDLVEEVLAELGAEFYFTGVKMQPGKPLVFGWLPGTDDRHGTYFFGLPGNPISTQVTFHCFVEPMLRAMCGAEVAGPRFVQATLSEDVSGKAGLTRVLPGRLSSGLERTEVRLVGWQGSGDLAANARANCYVVLGDGKDLRAGDVIRVLLR